MIQAVTFVVCTVLLAGICWLWVERDHREIREATGKHELKRKFHRQGLVWKMLSVVPLAIIFALTFKGWCMLYAGLAFSFFACAFWWYCFSRWLGEARGLGSYYLGKSNDLDLWLGAKAAKYDLSERQIIKRIKLPLIGIAFLLCIGVILSC